MAPEDVVLQEEEEDLGSAMQKLPIPFNELELGFTDGVKEILDDSNLLLEDSREFEDPSHKGSIDHSNDLKPYTEPINDLKLFPKSSNSPSATRGRTKAPKRSRNKRGRRKRQCFRSAACLFESKVGIMEKSCLHCGTRNTPLWREGPRGAGTLCNACGMRYRTGRLLPEYRPASSPGFKPNVHSNFHRKVMEIRKERNSPPNSFGSEDFQH